MTPGIPRPLSLLRPTMASGTPSSSILLTSLSITAATASLLYAKTASSSKTSLEPQQQQEKQDFKLNVDIMDRIYNKPYLPVSQERTVPRRLRLLVIDVPEMRFDGIDGECRVNPNKVFLDGIAPPKLVDGGKVKVEQKSLAKALVKCRSRESLRIGVEMTEASVAALNPHNVRKTHQFGSYKYDPGKYTTTTSITEEEEMEEQVETEEVVTVDETTTVTVTPPKMKKHKTVLATDEDEYDAPWNQYAWIQELQLRIGGKVAFGEPMQESSRLQRLLFGSVYKTTIPSCRAPWEYLLLLPIFHRNPAGHDWPGRKPNWASNKPHAVIAHGAAMQRVPGSLRFLQRTCQEEGVPLYIIHDARVWGGNTHQTLPEALQDLRKTIKQNIVRQAMQGGSSFRRGRLLGQAETEAKWQAKDIGRRTRQAVRDANEKLKREREHDWSHLNATELQDKLVGHNVIVTREGKDQKAKTQYTSGMVELSRKCVEDVAEQEGLQEDESNMTEAEAVDPGENGSQPASSIPA